MEAVCAKLNIFNKPMNILNMDETGVSVVHKGENVVTEVRRKNFWALTSRESSSPDASWPDTSPNTSSFTKTSSVGKSSLNDHVSENRKKYKEGCDIYTDDYLQWIRDNKLPPPTGNLLAHKPPLPTLSSSESTASSLREILALLKPIATKQKTSSECKS